MSEKQQDAEGRRVNAFLQEYAALCLKYGIKIDHLTEPCELSEVDENSFREELAEYERWGITIGK